MSLQQVLEEVVANLAKRIHALEVREPTPVATCVVAALPLAGRVGRLRLVTNGRKVGEGVGAGTGTLAYDDGTAWRRASDDTTVVA